MPTVPLTCYANEVIDAESATSLICWCMFTWLMLCICARV